MTNILKLRRENLAPNLAQDISAAMTVHQALLDEIDPNPFRDLRNAPLMETKVKALADHYAQHGAFPSVPVARQVSNRIQLAFGHHTLEAAKHLQLPSVNVEVRDLTDKQLIGLMPAEHGENGKRDFFVCLVAWMAALKEAKTDEEKTPTALARQFGWVRHDPRRPNEQPRMNATGMACAACAEVILDGRVELDWFKNRVRYNAHSEANRIKNKPRNRGLISPFIVDKNSEQLGFKKVETVDILSPLHNLKRPLQFKADYDINVVEPSLAALVTHIDRLFSPNNPQDELLRSIGDFRKSSYYLDKENRADMSVRLNKALDELALRANQLRLHIGVEFECHDD